MAESTVQGVQDAQRKSLELGGGSHGLCFLASICCLDKLPHRRETTGEQPEANLCPKRCQKDTKCESTQLSDLRPLESMSDLSSASVGKWGFVRHRSGGRIHDLNGFALSSGDERTEGLNSSRSEGCISLFLVRELGSLVYLGHG